MDLSAILNKNLDDKAPRNKGKTETGRTIEANQSLSRLLRLPAELYAPIVSHLSNQDIKSLRWTCSFFHGIARLHLQRVFVSAHQRDIQVLRAIADSETYRHGVTELIWDDARLSYAPLLAQAYNEDDEDENSEADNDNDQSVQRWFKDACHNNIDDLNNRKGLDAVKLPNPFSRQDGFAPNQVMIGSGMGVERDAFDPSHERPYVDVAALTRLDVLKKTPWVESAL